jgi:hypothetical protein
MKQKLLNYSLNWTVVSLCHTITKLHSVFSDALIKNYGIVQFLLIQEKTKTY